jgi:hypothetical protein
MLAYFASSLVKKGFKHCCQDGVPMFCGGSDGYHHFADCYKFSFKDKNWEKVKSKFHLFTIFSPSASASHSSSGNGSNIDI